MRPVGLDKDAIAVRRDIIAALDAARRVVRPYFRTNQLATVDT
jgi:hypothetical protein